MQHKQAAAIAVAICERLQPYCEPGRINIAGSIRRKKPEVKDIEIICMPKYQMTTTPTLFGDEPAINICIGFLDEAISLGLVIKGSPAGRYMQVHLPEEINLDLFMPQPHDYMRQFAIRTGSAEYSAKTIATAWSRAGWVGTHDGLRRRDECRQIAGDYWQCTALNPTLPPAWESEAAFFEWLGIEWIKPELRT